MKNKFLHKVFSLALAVFLLLPFAVEAIHILHNHVHDICDAKEIKHFHEEGIDCSSFHFRVNHNTTDFSSEFELKITVLANHIPVYFYESEYYTYLQSKSSRAPPYFIV